MLAGKHILLGITGGIAAYKSVSLLRLLVKAGADVQVVITPNGKEFITPVTLSALSGHPVISEFFTANTGEWHSHVDLGLWTDAMVIAPATACTISKMAHGNADNMLVTCYLSCKAPVFVAPAMDLDMMAHPSTTENIRLLESYGNHIIQPASGELASHLVGKGRMEEPEEIFKVLERFFQHQQSLKGKKILITAGPTYEKIDPVRFIGNYSSGKMGYAIAKSAADHGAEVVLVSGPVALSISHPNVEVIKVESAQEMLDACNAHFTSCDAAILSAAVADYAPETRCEEKIKRENEDELVLRLKRNPDIAATLGNQKRKGQILGGFALETNNEHENAVKKINNKNLDFIVLNSLRDPGAGFQTDTNKITIIDSDGCEEKFELKPKTQVADDIISHLASLLKK